MRPSDVVRTARRVVDKSKDKRPQYATVFARDLNRVDVRVANSPTVIHHVGVLGDMQSVNVGDVVRLIWQSDGRPMATVNAAIIDNTGVPVTSDTYYEFKEQTSAPETPATGYGKLYELSSNFLCFKNDASIQIPAMVGRVAFSDFMSWDKNSGMTTTTPESDIPALQFRDNYTDYIRSSFYLPHGWAGKIATVAFYWAPTTANTGSVIWGLSFFRVYSGANYPTSAADSGTIAENTPGVAKRVVKSTISLSLSTFAEGDLLYIKLYRSGSTDTYAYTVTLAGLAISVV